MLVQILKFVILCGVIFFVAWLAGTGHVGYVMVMLWIGAAFAFAVLDLVDYELKKREPRG